jgi:hypothetical protein
MARENDVVLISFEGKPLSFARIEKIYPDSKKDWYHVKLLMLQLPLQTVTWILRDVYIGGEEFTMGGKRMRIEPVVCPEDPEEPGISGKTAMEKDQPPEGDGHAKVISLSDLKKK